MNCDDIVVYKKDEDCNETLGKLVRGTSLGEFRFLPCDYGVYHNREDLDIATKSNTREATHEEKLQYIRNTYCWGNIIRIHSIGEYQIVESIRHKTNHHCEEVQFHVYINYIDTQRSYKSLDAALIGCVAIKYEGSDSHATKYFCRMIGINE